MIEPKKDVSRIFREDRHLIDEALKQGLAGFEVEEPDLPAFRAFLDGLGYPYAPESDNPAYRFFLG